MATRPKLGAGAYEPELAAHSEHWTSRYSACWRFLESVGERYPLVLEELDQFPHTASDLVAAVAPATALLEGKDLHSAQQALDWVRTWARRHRLESVLVLNAAVWTLCEWRRDGTARTAREWVFPGTVWQVPESSLAPALPDPLTEERAGWLKRAERLWDERVLELEAAYCSPTRKLNAQHFDWLARLVVGRETCAGIAKSADVSPQAVAKATRDLALLIELPLPAPARGGRPRRAQTNNI